MSRSNQHVPSVADLKRLDATREEAMRQGIKRPDVAQVVVTMPSTDATKQILERQYEVDKRVEALSAQVVAATKRRTPAELRESLLALFERDDFSPAGELYQMYCDRDTQEAGRFLSADQRIKILSELTSYVMSKIKSVEVKGRVDHEHKVTIVKFESQQVKVFDNRGDVIDVAAKRITFDGGQENG